MNRVRKVTPGAHFAALPGCSEGQHFYGPPALSSSVKTSISWTIHQTTRFLERFGLFHQTVLASNLGRRDLAGGVNA
jgi:hypothetical protein